MELHLKITGVLLIALALIHIVFPKYFLWKTELKGLSLINRQMMYVHMFFIALIIFLMGILCVTSSNELITTTFGKHISLGLAVFWFIRLFIQFFVYSTTLWKGKTFETTIHIFFSAMWIYFTLIFLFVSLNYVITLTCIDRGIQFVWISTIKRC